MAYAALVSLSQTIDRILSDDLYSISIHAKQHIVAIYEYVIFLQTFLDNFPGKTNSLEARFQVVANTAEDIIEYFMIQQIHPHFERVSKVEFEKQLEEVTDEIESIMAEVMEIKNSFKVNNCDDHSSSAASSSSSRAGPIHKSHEDAMVGFDDNLLAIKDRLCEESSALHVIPIYGMGGIGKTTLSRNAYHDQLIIECFHIRAWVTVSQNYSAENILLELLESFKESNMERSGQSNEEMVHKSLKGRRYLIVLDDIWSTEVWDDLRNIFPDDGNGSRIMLTTRLLDVAANPESSKSLYEMPLMDVDRSWNLLRWRVFKHQDCPIELEAIGRKIARSCRGLPLAIVVIAGVLSTISGTPTSWQEIARDVRSAVSAEHEQFEKILSLSYTHLPHHLRPCFLYLGSFWQHREIPVSQMIKLWVAEGFLRCPDGSRSLEEEAEECMEDLVKRSLVLVTKRKSNGKIKSCSLHDLMWDLCIKKAEEEKFIVHCWYWFSEKLRFTESPRRLSTSRGLSHLSEFYGSTIHTIICFDPTSLDPLENFRLLRVLDLRNAVAYVFPGILFELFHLRYFGVYFLNQIPAAISKLQNLQTLIIYKTSPWELPQEICNMPRLRHIVCHNMLIGPKVTTTTLENLQTLSSLPHYLCTEGILKMIPNLKKLEVDCSSYRQGTSLKDLVCLHQLEKLKLASRLYMVDLPANIISYPRMLKKLTLNYMQLDWDEMTVVGSLPNLGVLKLRDLACKGRIWKTSDGGFPQLAFLLIENSYLEDWITESSHFPSLRHLVLHDCWNLKDIPDGIGEIPTLELIEVKNKGFVEKSLVESAKRIQEEQQDLGNDSLQVVTN